MNRNQESRFSQIPQANISRSKFSRNFTHKTTFNAGKLIPIFVDEMLPGDTFSLDTSFFARMSTPIYPVMDNAYLDYYYFFVPNRLVWEHWQEFMGENTSAPWSQSNTYSIPQVSAVNESDDSSGGSAGFAPDSVADYMGVPTLVNHLSVSALPFRAYTLIWNEWFRSENVQYPAYMLKGDADRQSTGPDSDRLPVDGGALLPVDKFHDYFTSALPSPQKGPSVPIPWNGNAPLNTSLHVNNFTSTDGFGSPIYAEFGFKGDSLRPEKKFNFSIYDAYLDSGFSNSVVGSPMLNSVAGVSLPVSDSYFSGTNLVADLSSVSASINALRQAFQVQRFLETDARGGTRYIELIKAHFGVTSPDSRLQRPEYLGGHRFCLNMQQVLQTSSTDSKSPQGNTAAFSATTFTGNDFTYSATEHGFVIGVACVRTDHTYQQGLNRMWSRKSKYDFYFPEFAHLGEQAILNKELYAHLEEPEKGFGIGYNEEPFGYQEAWAEYRYKPSYVSGAMRSNRPNGSLDSWHYADYYGDSPVTLSDSWLRETAVNIDRTLAVQSSLEDQFIVDIAFKLDCVRPMPLYSIPGLIDHI